MNREALPNISAIKSKNTELIDFLKMKQNAFLTQSNRDMV
jgi:hypothetical protein